MKQLRFLMVAFTLLIGISLTSCMGDSDPTVGGTYVMKTVSTFPYTFVFSGSDIQYEAANNSELMGNTNLSLNAGDIVQIAWSYNSDEQPVTDATKKIMVKVSGVQNLSTCTQSPVLDNDGADEIYENATINKIGFANDYGSSSNGIGYYDKNVIVMPVVFLAKSNDLSKYEFSLVYDKSQVKEGDTELNLYLRYRTDEEKPTEVANVYKAFYITSALLDFKNVAKKAPTKIKIWANETNKSGSNSLDDAKDKLQSYEVDYTFKEETNN